MKTLISFALAMVMSTGIMAQEAANENPPTQEAGAEKSTAVPGTIDFQGRLHDSGGNPVNSTLNITFSLYNALSGGTALWTETKSVQVVDGLFHVKLGEGTPFSPTHFSGTDRWLGIKVGAEAEMSPRTKISSVGYAMQAAEGGLTLPYSGTVDASTVSAFKITNTGYGDGIYGRSSIYSGIVGVTEGSSSAGVRGVASESSVSSSAVWGVNYSSNGYSGFFEGGRFHISGNTGIGVTNPTAKLEVAGQVKITGGSPGAGKVLTSDANGLASWQPASLSLPFIESGSSSDYIFKITNTNNGGNGIYGINHATSTDSDYFGVRGDIFSPLGGGVFGKAFSNAGTASGVIGYSQAINGSGVYGRNITNSLTGTSFGVYGVADGPTGTGVSGIAGYATGNTRGIRGMVVSPDGHSGYFEGGRFYVSGNVGIGVENPTSKLEIAGQVKITGGSPGAGKVLTSDASGLASWQTPSEGLTLPYSGSCSSDDPAFSINQAGQGTGILVYNPSTLGSVTSIAGTTNSSSGIGVVGYVYSDEGQGIGVTGDSYSLNGTGIRGTARSTTGQNYGVYGETKSSSGYSGYFQGGKFHIQGNTGIGTENPSAKLEVAGQVKITGGSPGAGKVLTSDAAGLASWQSPSGSQWVTSGSDIYYNSGNVGIGLNNPAYKLEVVGATRINLKKSEGTWLAMRTDGTAGILDLSFSGGNLAIGGNANGENIILNPAKDSKVGVRTWTPAYDLDVNGTFMTKQLTLQDGTQASGKVLTSDANGLASWQNPSGGLILPYSGTSSATDHIFDLTNNGTGPGLRCEIKASAGTAISGISSSVSGSTFGVSGISNSSTTGATGVWGYQTSASGTVYGVRGEVTSASGYSGFFTGGRFHVSGRVAIGKTVPDYAVDVLGDRIRLSDATGDWIALRTDGASNDYVDLSFGGGSLVIQSSTANENIIINPSHNRVGIRTWTPQYDLDVSGDIRATGSVFYGGTAGSANGTPYNKPDFVFEENYPHFSIEEVSDFLEREKHLPWITSARQEKEENGDVIDMTRMAFETVETVENLQLQIIAQQKVINELLKRIEALEREMRDER